MTAKVQDKALIARKIGMTRIVDAQGRLVPVTLLKVDEQKVSKILTPERDGYHAYQVAYYPKARKNVTKSDVARLQKVGLQELFSRFKEFRTPNAPLYELGSLISADLFKDVASVDVTGVTKGRGFQGAVKRWGAAIGRMTHGSRFHRRPGSLGMRSTPGRVFKNKHQPGHMGVDVTTAINVKILDLDLENNVLAVKGCIPGHNDGFVEVRPSKKLK
ncbi:MAG: 50S ribosomal protein L3 [Oligoflexales bacterium]|nr:50S ribosomal protein L3 [Oligoflexales bacterium]